MDLSYDIDWKAVVGDAASLVRPETASKYFPRNPLRQSMLRGFLRRVGLALEARPWSSLLDLGCGEGFVDYYLSRRFPERRITGAEPEAAALEVARRINPGLSHARVDGRRLPFADRAFDAGICLEVLEHLRDYRAVLAELGRVSRRVRVVSVPCRPWYQGMRFLTGRSWSRLGEHPDHVVGFTARSLLRDLESTLGGQNRVVLSLPWIIGINLPREVGDGN